MLVHLGPTENVNAQAWSLLAVLDRLRKPHTPQETVVYDIGNDFVLVAEVALGRAQLKGTRLGFSNLFKDVWQLGKFDEGSDLPGFHVDHLVVEGRFKFDLKGMVLRRTLLPTLAALVHHNQIITRLIKDSDSV